MAAKTTSVLYFSFILLHDFWFLHGLELINLCLMFLDQNDLCLTFKFKTVTANTHIKAVFMHVHYNMINNICLIKNKNIDYVITQIRLQGIRNCIYS